MSTAAPQYDRIADLGPFFFWSRDAVLDEQEKADLAAADTSDARRREIWLKLEAARSALFQAPVLSTRAS